MSEKKELLEIVDKSGKVLGIAERSELHDNPSLIHRVVHVLVFNNRGELLLQKRSMKKDVAPRRWDTSVGGHINPGEDIITAANREMEEELGIGVKGLDFLYTYLFTNHRESELVSTFSCIHNGSFHFNKDEIDELKFWEIEKIKDNLGRAIFSSHLEKEIGYYLNALSSNEI